MRPNPPIQPLEALESRRLLAASLSSSGVLKVVGEEDTANAITVALNSAGTQYDVTINGQTESFDVADVKRLRISGGDEADNITVESGVKVRARVNGNGGDDVIAVLAKRSLINGGDGDDSIVGSPKSDTISGGAGNDTIEAGSGDDKVFGNDGDDSIAGNAGDNEIDGGAGADTLLGSAGNDLIIGRDGDDSIDGGTGDDELIDDDPEYGDDYGDCGGGAMVGEFGFGRGGRGPHHERPETTTGDSGDDSITTARNFSLGGMLAATKIR